MTMNTIDGADLIAPRETLAYHDSQSIDLPRAIAPLEAWNLMMAQPQPILKWAFRVRDAISARFGVKRIGGFSGRRRDRVTVGDRLDFFLVEGASPDLLLLTERDRHLDVMTAIRTTGARLTITSSVVVHNWFGRAYMLPVGPAHRVIVRIMLARLRKGMRTANP
ncbi:DUF2867 domain-containing protein [Novosphingobium rosa]|uniref:DUF2867 domain-containing protein n=1 Tax=Novosphingobium rosa TaxID=76978 RepID=UPI000B125D55|nr:DUF2867 domain-containing protein [Novosphingobium rosa]